MSEENQNNQDNQDPGGFPPGFLERLRRKPETKTCTQCQTEFTTQAEADLCLQCSFYATHPEMAPKYWMWQKRASGVWGVQARWPENDPLPEPGDQVTVHRKNGSSSVETLREVEGLIFQLDGTARLTCFIK